MNNLVNILRGYKVTLSLIENSWGTSSEHVSHTITAVAENAGTRLTATSWGQNSDYEGTIVESMHRLAQQVQALRDLK